MKCKIQWIDQSGKPTPDENPAVNMIRTKERIDQVDGRPFHVSMSPWYPVCAEHMKRMNEPGMHIWEVMKSCDYLEPGEVLCLIPVVPGSRFCLKHDQVARQEMRAAGLDTWDDNAGMSEIEKRMFE